MMTKAIKTKNSVIKQIIKLVKTRERILLSSHVGPDGDSLGSQLSFYHFLKSLGKQPVIYNQGHIPHYFHSFPEHELIKTEAEQWLVPKGGFELAIIFECTSLDRVGDVAGLIHKPIELINIDHHLENAYFGDINYVDSSASSVGEMNFNIFKQAGFEIDRQVAEYLFTAILTDTGRFHFSSTSPNALRVAAELVAMGINVKDLTDRVYYNFAPGQLRYTCEVIARMELYLNDQVCFLVLPDAELKQHNLKYGDMEGLVEWTMRIKGVKVGALLKDIDPHVTKVSLRSQGQVDVCRLAQAFQGGGHLNASGCHIAADLDTARKILLEKIAELLKNGK